MAADLHDLTGIRGWLTDSLLAYLFYVLREESTPPGYFPKRLRDRPEVLQTLWRRLQVRSRPEPDETFGRPSSADGADGEAGHAPRRRADGPESLASGALLTDDEETVARYARAVITGEPGAGKTWLLRRIAHRTAHAAVTALGVQRSLTVHDVVWPIRVRLPELAGSAGLPIETVLARGVVKGAGLGFAAARQYAREVGEHSRSDDLAAVAQALGAVAPEVFPGMTAFVTNAVLTGRACLLLDAWDEVAESSREDLRRRLRKISQDFPAVRMIATTRDGGGLPPAMLTSSARLGDPVADLELLSLERDQVNQFCDEWFKDFSASSEAGVEPRRPAVELKRVLGDHPPMRELARNPLMLTFMARLAEHSAALPTRRVELYGRVLNGILSQWAAEDEKPPDGSIRIEAGVSLDDHVALLAEIACRLVEAGQLNEFREKDVCDLVEARRVHLFAPDRHIRTMASNDVLALWKGTGLLVPIGMGTVAFLHRTFQEYLAGIALVSPAVTPPRATTEQRETGVVHSINRLVPLLEGTSEQRATWEEPIRLGLGYLGLIAEDPDACSAVVRGIIARAPGPPGRAVAAMGDAVAEISSAPDRSAATSVAQGVTVQCRDDVAAAALACMRGELRGLAGTIPSVPSTGHAATAPEPAGLQRLVAGMLRWASRKPSPPEHHLPAVSALERVACGNALARLSDPRFHGSTSEAPRAASDVLWGLPADDLLGFVLVTPPKLGTFEMGSDDTDGDSYDDEKPRQRVRLTTPCYMGRWPVTVAQFQLFVQARGYTDAGTDREKGVANHPVVHVSFRDAWAYCDWLTRELLAPGHRSRLPAALQAVLATQPDADWRISLPTEPQWEWAARGPARHVYPGGQPLTPERANYDETGIETTSAVGCFRPGASWCGIEDLAGNAWEWTRSTYQAYSSETVDAQDPSRDAPEGDDQRVLRGGAFYNDRGGVRAASRDGHVPGHRDDALGFRVVLCPFRS